MKRYINKIWGNNLIKSFVVLLTGEGISSILGIISMALIVAAINLEGNGIILSVQTYCILITSIFGFKSFQALIKYISKAIEKNDVLQVKLYIKQSYILDIIASLVATIVSLMFAKIYGNFMGWNSEIVKLAYIYSVAGAFQIQGTPIGILRVYNKFDYITYNNIFIAFIRVILFAIGIFIGANIEYYFVAETILYILPNIILNLLCYKTLKDNKLQKFYLEKIKLDKEFVRFNFYSNITSTIDLPIGTLTTIMINKYLGYDQISIYKIFEKIGSIVSKLGAPIGQIIYPEMSNKIAKKEYDQAKRLNEKLMMFISGIGIILIIGVLVTHKMWLKIFIPEYDEYLISLIMYLMFVVFINATVGVHSLFMALDYIKYTIPILIGINSVYIVVMYFLINYIGLNGVIMALFVQAVAVVTIKTFIMSKNGYKERCVL